MHSDIRDEYEALQTKKEDEPDSSRDVLDQFAEMISCTL
jgi:hypothetical protein